MKKINLIVLAVVLNGYESVIPEITAVSTCCVHLIVLLVAQNLYSELFLPH